MAFLLKIASAYYGSSAAPAIDVTTIVSTAFQNLPANSSRLNLTVNSQTFNPGAPGTNSLVVNYYWSNSASPPPFTSSATDGNTLAINTYPYPSGAWKIISATYGSSNIFVNISARMQRWMNMSHNMPGLVFTVGSSRFLAHFCDGDPDPNVSKTLFLNYTDGTTPVFVCASDGQEVNMSTI